MTNVLQDPIIHARTHRGDAPLSLPQVMAGLATDDIEDFTGLRSFQEHPWHAFLVQLGTLALISAGLDRPPPEPAAWQAMLEDLTHDQFPGGEPWELINEDYSMPALLQPPVLDPAFQKKAKILATPDSIDLTVGSRRHDVKDGSAVAPRQDHWLYALISAQTADGFIGNSLYSISRMNKGFGNRHGFSITPSTRWGPHVCRDMTVLASFHRGAGHLGRLLLWTRPWAGNPQDSIPLSELQPTPLYIEICRRMRLFTDAHGRIKAARHTSKSPRIDHLAALGNVGDPWTLTQGQKATTVADRGFSARSTTNYLDPSKNTLPLLARHHPQTDGDAPMYLVARALARGQGGTEGYHSAIIPISNTLAAMLDSGEKQELLAQAAQARLAIIAETQRILYAALRSYTNMQPTGAQSWASRIEQEPVPLFWAALGAEIDDPDPEAERARWTHEELLPKAAAILREAHRSLGANAHTRYEAQAKSEDLFRGMIRNSKNLPPRPEPPDTADGQPADHNQPMEEQQ